jgi:hypothetical protein
MNELLNSVIKINVPNELVSLGLLQLGQAKLRRVSSNKNNFLERERREKIKFVGGGE